MAEETRSREIITDFISGERIRAIPGESETIQVFSRQLVEDYGYPRENIRTRPQYRLRQGRSGGKSFPVGIMVFEDSSQTDVSEYIVVECRKKTRKDGKKQLQDSLQYSRASLGVWFNGSERLFLRKLERDGKTEFQEIPNIPRFGQRVEDIGMFRRKDLVPTHNLKVTFRAIRNHLAANNVGATRDEVLAQQLINLIFCKIYDERFTGPEDDVTFKAGTGEPAEEVRERILGLFSRVKGKYPDVLDDSDSIILDAGSVAYVVGELQNYSLIETERDSISDAFEIFIGHALKGGQGQFFTPRNVARMMVEILDPTGEELIIDPACGSGGFLIESLRHIWRKIDAEGKKSRRSSPMLPEEKMSVAMDNIYGMDKDYFLSKLAKAYMSIMGDGKSGIFCEDSLEEPGKWSDRTREKIIPGEFSVLLTNPPFGSRIPVRGEEKLAQYDLAHKWKFDRKSGSWVNGDLNDSGTPQVLFIERSLQMLREGGRMAIVLPDGIFGNESLGYVRSWLMKKARVVAIIDVPLETFLPNTGTKTSIMVLQKLPEGVIPEDYPIFLAVAEFCGHDRRGKEVPRDDIARISGEFARWAEENSFSFRM